MTALPWDPALLVAAARFAPDPSVARRLAGLGVWPEVSDYDPLFSTERLRALCPPLRFVLQPPRSRRRSARPATAPSYDACILDGAVPTRARNWHDLFNALIWAAMPAAKMALHRHQHALIRERLTASAHHGAQARSRVEDAVAMVDEGGLLLACRSGIEGALQEATAQGDQAAILALISAGRVLPVIFGHALLEHLARGQLDVRGFPVILPVDTLALPEIEEALAGAVRQLGPPSDRPGVSVPTPFFCASE